MISPSALNLFEPFQGIVPPMVSPLLDSNTVDKEGLERLVEHLIRGGVHGIFVLGTTGEGASLSGSLRRELISLTARQVQGRLPVFVGISDSSIKESLAMAAFAAESGADAVVATPPFYFGIGQEEIADYFIALADDLALPLFLYNIPSVAKTGIAPETVKRLSSHPKIIGLKDSSGNAVYLNTVLYLLQGEATFSLLVGPEEMLATAVLSGAHGGVNGGANIFPRLYVSLYNACIEKDFHQIGRLRQKVMEVSEKIYGIDGSAGAYLKGLKASLSLLGICNDFLAPPFRRFGEVERSLVKENLEGLSAMEYRNAGE